MKTISTCASGLMKGSKPFGMMVAQMTMRGAAAKTTLAVVTKGV